jgi:hypothetical protein
MGIGDWVRRLRGNNEPRERGFEGFDARFDKSYMIEPDPEHGGKLRMVLGSEHNAIHARHLKAALMLSGRTAEEVGFGNDDVGAYLRARIGNADESVVQTHLKKNPDTLQGMTGGKALFLSGVTEDDLRRLHDEGLALMQKLEDFAKACGAPASPTLRYSGTQEKVVPTLEVDVSHASETGLQALMDKLQEQGIDAKSGMKRTENAGHKIYIDFKTEPGENILPRLQAMLDAPARHAKRTGGSARDSTLGAA